MTWSSPVRLNHLIRSASLAWAMISPQPFLNSYSVPSEISAARVIVRMPAVTAPVLAPATGAHAALRVATRSRHTLAWLMQYPPARLDAICGLPSRTSLLANLDPEALGRATAQDSGNDQAVAPLGL